MQPHRILTALAVALLATLAPALPAAAQCLLANPSFELTGSGGAVFGGWNQFGVVGADGEASHGALAARVSGPGTGGWDVSGYWQQLDTAAADRWAASVRVRVGTVRPLSGQSKAIVNIEWRDAAGALISYESHDAATAASPTDQWLDFEVVSGPAPDGAVGVRLLLGVLQSPVDPSPDVLYDEAVFTRQTTPSLDELQWSDFPGGRTLDFGGRSWRVKGPGYYGPGPNLFSDTESSVWVDAEQRLHLTIRNVAGAWYSTEVVLEEALGYGDYVFTTRGSVDLLDAKAVCGLFLWQYGPCYDPATTWWNPFNEIDVELSRWGDPARDLCQYVAQPYDYPGNLIRFDAAFAADERASHAFRWLPDRIEFRSWRGGPADESAATRIQAWTYTGPHIPRPEQPRVHLNLWLMSSPPAGDQEVVLDAFTFYPGEAVAGVGPLPAPLRGPPGRLHPAAPNPFNPATTLRFSLDRRTRVDLTVYAVDGRRVCVLVGAVLPAGDHQATWDGRDQGGHPVPSGVYLCQLRAGDGVETRPVVLVK